MTDRPLTATEAELCETIQDLSHRVTALRKEGEFWETRADELAGRLVTARAQADASMTLAKEWKRRAGFAVDDTPSGPTYQELTAEVEELRATIRLLQAPAWEEGYRTGRRSALESPALGRTDLNPYERPPQDDT